MEKPLKTLLIAWSKTVRVLLICGAVGLCLPVGAFGDDIQSRIDEYFKSRVASSDLQVDVLLSRKDKPLIRGEYGKSGLTQVSTTNDPNSIFPVGAVAEQFVAVAFLRLQEQGRIKLESSVCDYLSECPNEWSEVWIVHLLTHTSGLPLPNRSFASGQNSPSLLSVQSVLADFDASSTRFKPGTAFRYNPFDFVILNIVLGELSRQSPDKYFETQLFRPHKVLNTEYSAWAGATSTVEDLYRWDLALTGTKIISRNSFNEMLTPYRDGYSLGWKIIKEFDRRVALQVGESGSTSVSIRMYPDDETFIIVVAHGVGAHAAPLSHDVAAIALGRHYPLSRGF